MWNHPWDQSLLNTLWIFLKKGLQTCQSGILIRIDCKEIKQTPCSTQAGDRPIHHQWLTDTSRIPICILQQPVANLKKLGCFLLYSYVLCCYGRICNYIITWTHATAAKCYFQRFKNWPPPCLLHAMTFIYSKSQICCSVMVSLAGGSVMACKDRTRFPWPNGQELSLGETAAERSKGRGMETNP